MKVRIVLANMPRILTHILRDLVNRQPDMAVMGEVRSLADLPPLVASLHPQAVILTFSPPSTNMSVCCRLRERSPTLTLLGLAVNNDRAGPGSLTRLHDPSSFQLAPSSAPFGRARSSSTIPQPERRG